MEAKGAWTLRGIGAALLALALLPVAWYAIVALFSNLGNALGGPGLMETFVRVGWFVGPAIGGFVALWAPGTLIRDIPMREVFVVFLGLVAVMFLIAFTALYLSGGLAETTFVIGMFGQLVLVFGGAWLGRRVVEGGEKGRG